MSAIRIGIVGCGNISHIYFENFATFRQTTVTACADLDVTRAAASAEKYGIPWSGTTDELMARDDVDLVVNLTIPAAHHSVAKAALEAGKMTYNEKPFSVERSQGQELLDLTSKFGLACGGAPDTFFGASHQTCRKLIDEGLIGEPIGFNAFMLGHGADGWHPNPDFFYRRGGGPLFDMGPYYLTVLTFLLGPIEKVTAITRSETERALRFGPDAGRVMKVETPTHISASLKTQAGAVGALNVSFDVWASQHHDIEIYGTEGTLAVSDPNSFGNPIKYRRSQKEMGEKLEWEDIPLTFRFAKNSRGIGALDLAVAHRDGRPARAGGELTFHVLDVMHSILESAEQEKTLKVGSTVERPAPLAEMGPDDDL